MSLEPSLFKSSTSSYLPGILRVPLNYYIHIDTNSTTSIYLHFIPRKKNKLSPPTPPSKE